MAFSPRFTLTLTVISMSVFCADVGSAEGLRDFGRELDKAGRNLCDSLNLKCRPSARTQRKKARRAIAANRLPESAIPIPRQKPADLGGNSSLPALATAIPTPRQKPAHLGREKPESLPPIAAIPLPRSKPGTPSPPSLPLPPPANTVLAAPPIPDQQCLSALRQANVEFETALTPVSTGACQVSDPVRVTAVTTPLGTVRLPDRPTLNCRFARQFALWLTESGAAIVSSSLKSNLERITTGPGFECRGRNGDPSAKLSEHAYGNAVDITTFATADGRSVAVADAGNPAAPAHGVLAGLRASACTYFTTVLGPGANAAHASHFHFDMGRHGKSNTYRICQ
jgi:hypothetical protein